MITWEQIGWTERAWGHQVYLYLVDKETGEQFNEAPGFDHKPTDEEVKEVAEATIARILQSRIDQVAEAEAAQIKAQEELAKEEAMSTLQGRVKELEGQLEATAAVNVELEAQVAVLQEAKLALIEEKPIGG